MTYTVNYMSDAIGRLRAFARRGRWRGVNANNFAMVDEGDTVCIRLLYEVEGYFAHILELYMDCDKEIYFTNGVAYYTCNDSVSRHVNEVSRHFFKTSTEELRKHGIANDNPQEWYYVTDEANAVAKFAEFLDIMIPIILRSDFSMKDDPEPSNQEMSIKDKVEGLFGSAFDVVSPREDFNKKVAEGKFVEYRK
jgi:hypothetical protein